MSIKKLNFEIAGKGWQEVNKDVSKLVKSLDDLKKSGVNVDKMLAGIKSGEAFSKFSKGIEASKKNIESLNEAIKSGQKILADSTMEAERRVKLEEQLVQLTQRKNALSQQRVINTIAGFGAGMAAGGGIAGAVYGGVSTVAGAFLNRTNQQEMGKNAAVGEYNSRAVDALKGNAYREIYMRSLGKEKFVSDYTDKTLNKRMAQEGYLFNAATGGKFGRTGSQVGEIGSVVGGGLLAGGVVGGATLLGGAGLAGAGLGAMGLTAAGATIAGIGALPLALGAGAGYMAYRGLQGVMSDPFARRQSIHAEQRANAAKIWEERNAPSMYVLDSAMQKADTMSELQRMMGTKVFGTDSMGVNGALGHAMGAGFSEANLIKQVQQIATAGGSSGMQNQSFLKNVAGLGRDTGVDAMGTLYGTVTSKTGASGEQAFTLLKKAFSESIGKVPFKIEKEAYAQAVGEATRRIGSQNNLGAEGFSSIAAQILKMINPNSGIALSEQIARAGKAIEIQGQAGSTGVGMGIGLSNAGGVLRGAIAGGGAKTADIFRLQELMSTPGMITADNPEVEDIYQRQFGGTKTTKAKFLENLKGAQKGMIEKSLSFMVPASQFKKMSVSQKANLARQFGGFKNRSQADMESFIQGVYAKEPSGQAINMNGSITGDTLGIDKETSDAKSQMETNKLIEKNEKGIKQAVKQGGDAAQGFGKQMANGDFGDIAASLETNLGKIAKALNNLNLAASKATSRMPGHIE